VSASYIQFYFIHCWLYMWTICIDIRLSLWDNCFQRGFLIYAYICCSSVLNISNNFLLGYIYKPIMYQFWIYLKIQLGSDSIKQNVLFWIIYAIKHLVSNQVFQFNVVSESIQIELIIFELSVYDQKSIFFSGKLQIILANYSYRLRLINFWIQILDTLDIYILRLIDWNTMLPK
jgi:hypothetical protein